MARSPRRYVVVGAGGVGVAVAASLQDAGADVVLVARGAVLAAARERGLVYTRPGSRRVLDVPVAPDVTEVPLGADDLLVLATKTQDVEPTLRRWAWQPGADRVPVATLQNGLEAERVAARYAEVVVGGTTLVAARHVVPGEVHVANRPAVGQLVLGAAPSADLAPRADEVAAAVADDLRAGGWLTQHVAEIARWKAWKLLHNVTNATELLAGEPHDLDRLRAAVVDEARAALTAAGHGFAEPDRERTFDPALAAVDPAGGWRPGQQSTWQSFARGSGSEVDFLNGEVVLAGRLHGVPTPANAALQRVLGASALAGEPPATRHLDEVLALLPTGALR